MVASFVLSRLSRLPIFLISLLVGIAVFGVAMLYSSVATNPIESDLYIRHGVRFAAAFFFMLCIAIIPIAFWARIAFPFFLLSLVLLIGVELFGVSGGGATRWLDVGPIRLQPSELMKLALILALARYYHMALKDSEPKFWTHVPSLFLILAPTYLIFRQPDLGTALMLLAAGGSMIVFAGLQWRYIFAAVLIGAVSAPMAYFYVLKDYQRERVLTAIDPSRDPLGAGYQIQQAKIAIGSGGLQGRGFMQGTQSQLDYIPEQHTDFIFTVVAEELGFLGAFSLMMAWALVLTLTLRIAMNCGHTFGRLVCAGVVVTIGFYIVVNTGMVMGLLPVVGVPFPLLSYGGTVMLVVMSAFGIVCSAHIDQEEQRTLILNGLI